MNSEILLSATRLEQLAGPGILAVDCRFDLTAPEKGRQAYLQGHVPGAAYAHLDDDLSSPILPHTGRHPLPESRDFARFLARIGWTEERLLVAYDEGANAISVRLWWLMRYHGLPAAVLDGGLAAWRAAGFGLEQGEFRGTSANVPDIKANAGMIVSTETLSGALPDYLVLDARASERFSGEVEPLDSRAGHIPGAVNRPFGSNLQMNGRFKAAETLKEEFRAILGGRPLDGVLHSCGSGVTACHNQFAMELAGLGGTKIYPGSWSEWIRDPDRPIETGE